MFKSIKTRLILQISLLIIVSTLFVLVFVNFISQQRAPKEPLQVAVDTSLSWHDQREYIQEQIKQNIQQERAENTARLLLASLIGIFFQVIFTSVGAYLLIGHELKPLRNFNKSISEINERLLYLQINSTEETSIEIKQLIGNFNKMMSRLDMAFNSQKQFVENVSHEIKTPLTIIRSNLESVILDRNITKLELDTALKSSIDSIAFLNRLVEDLMLLSFLEKSDIKVSVVNLRDIIQVIKSELEETAKKNNLVIKFNVIDDAEFLVMANNVLLKRAISNLIENAIKYSYKKTEILIKLYSSEDNIELSVRNEGDTIPEEYKEKIFDRFFRIDKSRSRTTGGFGLGLAITKEIIETFKGDILLKTNHTSNEFVIKFAANKS